MAWSKRTASPRIASAALGVREIAALPAWAGTRQGALGDFFKVRGERSARVCVLGSVANVNGLGAGMTGGELIIDGDAGDRVGAGMTGGLVDVRGNVRRRCRRGDGRRRASGFGKRRRPAGRRRRPAPPAG